MTITPDKVIPLLLSACPSFDSEWESSKTENLDESAPGGRLYYLDAGDFVRHIVALKASGETGEFPAVFDVIERFVCEGDAYVKNLGVIGYIEGFQMMTVTSAGLDPERDFRPWMRPTSESWWQRLNRFWGGDSGALIDGDAD